MERGFLSQKGSDGGEKDLNDNHVAMEVQSPLVDQTNAVKTGGGSYPPLLAQGTTPAGKTLGELIRAIVERFVNTAYGFFLGKRVAYPVVANYVRNTWGKFGLVKSMLSSSTMLFSFQFSFMDGLNSMLENGPLFIRNHPLIIRKWNWAFNDKDESGYEWMAEIKECMQTRSSKFVGESSTNPTSTNPKRRNRQRSKQRVEPFALEEVPVVTMADQRTMAELLRAPTEGYAEVIVVPPIPTKHFELKHSLINLVTSKQFYGFEDPHAHIRYFNKITSTLRYKDVAETSIKLCFFNFLSMVQLDLARKEPPRSILHWAELVSKFINHFFPPLKTTNLRNEISNFNQNFTELHQLDTFYNGLNPSDQDSLNSTVGGNLLETSTQDALKIIENKSRVWNSRNKPIVSQVKATNVDSLEMAKLTDAVTQQTNVITSSLAAMMKQFQATQLQLL
ncbi:reverse transcriptase domain-containing protein [Tanacetum coccineum]